MGRLTRLKRITAAKIEAFLDSLERPADILPQLEMEMSQKVTEAANAEAKALTALLAAQRKVDEATGRALRLEKGARLALAADDLDTALRATAALIEAEQSIARHNTALDTARKACDDAKSVRSHLRRNLADLKARKKDILARDRRLRLHKELTPPTKPSTADPTADILETIARMEAKVDRTEAQIHAHNQAPPTVDLTLQTTRLDQELRRAEVEKRLAQIKANHPPSPPGRQ